MKPGRERSPLSPARATPTETGSLRDCIARLGLARGRLTGLPFLDGDATAGTESELQAAVVGGRDAVDLALTIEGSSYFANLRRRAARGDLPASAGAELDAFLAAKADGVWENSWVRLPLARLTPATRALLEVDLSAVRSDPASPPRADRARFFLEAGGEELLRVPISYLLRLALAEAVERGSDSPLVRRVAGRLSDCFTNDNISPETTSFHVVTWQRGRGALDLARECAKRFLLCQLLTAYANRHFELTARGQEALVFHSPLPPLAQRRLADLVSDSFYRELFISPCLSGWERGEDKQDYMALCHHTLARSQLHAVARLREAGIIRNNLVVLPSTSNLSLANNGTHVSLGSRRLSAARADAASGFGAVEEKRIGDLAIKIAEHFLPLFVGTYTAAPFRLGFADFHPEKVLGFLPHELDFTHLRMLWRRWRGKARIHFLGRTLTPFGPPWLDGLLARALCLSGDWVPDLRLLDYPVALASTPTQPALDGRPGNTRRLRRELEAMGVTDARMALYLPLRLREHAEVGFCGFEGRHYSLFESFEHDLGRAAELQLLVLAYAWKLIVDGRVRHESIPDLPELESERRQLFFAAAMGVPTVYVRAEGGNAFLREVIERTSGVRSSRRYPGWLRVELAALQRALVAKLEREAADLTEALGARGTLADLRDRLSGRVPGAADRLVAGILGGPRRSPFELPAADFNLAAERFYREDLRRRQLAEAAQLVAAELGEGAREILRDGLRALSAGRAGAADLERMIVLLVLSEASEEEQRCQPTSTWTARRAAS
ncbi:MAG TPA: hypothetical protein VF017_09920 [Thermoanaerobaculia bacterium]|nr:hypothetical protein [Thermoanaerobaculia bacterium]